MMHKNIIFSIFEKITKLLLLLAFSSLVSKFISLEVYGEYSYHLLIFSTISFLIPFGLDTYFINDVSKKAISAKSALVNLAFVRLFMSIFCFVIFLLFVYISSFDFSIKTTFFIFIAFLFFSLDILDVFYRAKNEIYKVSLVKIVSYLLSFLIKVTLIYFSSDYLIYSFSFDFVIVILIYFVFIVRGYLVLPFSIRDIMCFFNLNYILRYIKLGFGVVVSYFIINIYMKLDQFMINDILGYNELGLYSLSVQISMALSLVVQVTLSVCFRNLNSSKTNKWRYIFTFNNLVFFLSFFFFLFIRDELWVFIFGDDVSGLSDLLLLMVLNAYIYSIGCVLNAWVSINSSVVRLSLSYLFSSLLAYVLNYYFIPEFGVEGAALATVISQTFAILILPCLMDRAVWAIIYEWLYSLTFLFRPSEVNKSIRFLLTS